MKDFIIFVAHIVYVDRNCLSRRLWRLKRQIDQARQTGGSKSGRTLPFDILSRQSSKRVENPQY